MNSRYEKLLSLMVISFIVLVPVVPFKKDIAGIPIGIDTIIESLLIISLLLYYIKKSRFAELKGRISVLKGDRIMIAMLVILLIMIISVFYAAEAKLALKESLRFASYIIIYYVIKYEVRDINYSKNLLLALTAVGFITGIVGLLQYTGIIHLGREFITNYGNGHIVKRIPSTMQNSNNYGAFLIICFFPIVMSIKSFKNVYIKFFMIFTSLLIAMNIFFTSSRAAWIAFAIGWLTLIIIYNRKLIYPFLVIGAASMFIPAVSKRIFDIFDASQNNSRIKLWKLGLKVIKENPIFGVGNGNFVSVYDEYARRYPLLGDTSVSRFPMHNVFIKIQSELGVFGLLSFGYLLVAVVLDTLKYVKNSNGIIKSISIGFFAAIPGFIFMNIVDQPLFVPQTAAFFWILSASISNRNAK